MQQAGQCEGRLVALVKSARDAHAHEPNPVLPQTFVPDLLRGHKQMSDAGLEKRNDGGGKQTQLPYDTYTINITTCSMETLAAGAESSNYLNVL